MQIHPGTACLRRWTCRRSPPRHPQRSVCLPRTKLSCSVPCFADGRMFIRVDSRVERQAGQGTNRPAAMNGSEVSAKSHGLSAATVPINGFFPSATRSFVGTSQVSIREGNPLWPVFTQCSSMKPVSSWPWIWTKEIGGTIRKRWWQWLGGWQSQWLWSVRARGTELISGCSLMKPFQRSLRATSGCTC